MARRARGGKRGVRLLIVAVLAVLMAGFVWGLGGAFAATSDSPSPEPGSAAPSGDLVVLQVGWANDPDSLNPFLGYENSSYEIWRLNYNMLFGYAAADGTPTPELAAEIPTKDNGGISADGLVWTIKLRPGITWQDGEPFTADDVAWTYNFIIDNQAAAFSAFFTDMKKVEVVDDTTVKLICTKPKANILTLWVPILPEHIWGKMSPKEVQNSYSNKPSPGKPMIGTGPFQCVEWNKGEFARMNANPTYSPSLNPDGVTPTVGQIVFKTYTNTDTMTQELKNGTIDMIQSVPAAQFDILANTEGIEAIAYNTRTWEYLSFNCYTDPASQGNPVLTDVAFRQAVAWAVDKQKCVDVGWTGRATVGTTMLPPGQWQNPDYHWQPSAEQLQGFDLTKAAAMLEAAGYKDVNGDGLRETKDGKALKLRLWSRSESQPSQNQGKILAGNFKKIGLDITYSVMDDGVMSDKLYATADNGNTYAPDYDMYLWDWIGYVDPGDTMVCFTTDQIWMWNDPCWSNSEYDKLATAQSSELDKDKRKQMIDRMQEIMYEEVPEVILDYPQDLEAYNTAKWEGYVPYRGGAVFYSAENIDTYLNLQPIAGSEGSKSNTGLYTGLAVAAIVIVAIVLIIVLRSRRTKAVEE